MLHALYFFFHFYLFIYSSFTLKAIQYFVFMMSFWQFGLFLPKNSPILWWIVILLHFARRRPVANQDSVDTIFCCSLQVVKDEHSK